MSELIHNNTTRFAQLADFTRELIKGENGKMLYDKHQAVIKTVTPTDAMQLIDLMMQDGFSHEEVKQNVGKIINTFFKPLNLFEWERPSNDHFLSLLMLENRAVEAIMNELKNLTKELYNGENQDSTALYAAISQQIEALKKYELHYIKKENILFPYLEKTFSEYRCLQIMWSFHDDFRRIIKTIENILQSDQAIVETLNKALGKLFFVVLPIIFREEKIVFPVAMRAVPENAWQQMLDQSHEIGWCYIEKPQINQYKSDNIADKNMNGTIDLGSGLLQPEQIILMLNHLPVDISFIDENDEVRYFSETPYRIFPRSRAIIGRKVQNCHPPESVHVVNEIVEAFRSGAREHADFHIQMKGKFIYIRYFAIRDENLNYKGTIEVSQEVTEIRALQGERRLLEWRD